MEVINCLTEDELDFLIISIFHTEKDQPRIFEVIVMRLSSIKRERGTYIQYIHIIPNSSFSFFAHIFILVDRIR